MKKEYQVEIRVVTVFNVSVKADSKEKGENIARDQYDSGVYEDCGEKECASFEVFDN